MSARITHTSRRSVGVCICLLVGLACLAGALVTPRPAAAGNVLRGLGGAAKVFPTSATDLTAWNELVAELHPEVIRVDISWPGLEPHRGEYNDTYIQRLSAGIDTIRASGAQVLIQVSKVPRWASDTAYWRHPVAGDKAGVYRTFYPVRRDRLADFRACMQYLAAALNGKVLGYICWNEPNLWSQIFPQRTSRDGAFAAHHYARMLKAFAAGVRAADPEANVVGGETAPAGQNTRYSTSPQRFARVLRRSGAGASFDVYSHHPYAVGGSKHIAPDDMPRDPTHAVSMANLGTLLRIFPTKPFYLTEFAYSTAFSFHFGICTTEAGQATYLRRAYALAARHSQVRLLLWWSLRDTSKTGSYRDEWGWYLGLRRLDNSRKPAYFAFAGGNRLVLEPPEAIAAGSAGTLQGTLTSKTMGALSGKTLRVQRRSSTGWVTVTTVRTGSDGAYSVRVRPRATTAWRLVWPGVATSARQRLLVQ